MEHEHEKITGVRCKLDLCRGWSFVKRDMGRRWLSGLGADGVTVDLPHCWNESDVFREDVVYYRGPGCYRRSFDLPAGPDFDSPASCFLATEGFYGTGDVWLNGARVARVDGQYLGFRLDVTPFLLWNGANVLGIRLTNRCASHVLPGIADPDFLLYGGLAGGMWLEQVPDVRLEGSETRISCREMSSASAMVDIGSCVSAGGSRGYPLKAVWRIIGPDGRVAGESAADIEPATQAIHADPNSRQSSTWTVTSHHGAEVEHMQTPPGGRRPPGKSLIAARFVSGRIKCSVSVRVADPRLWSVENPVLYLAEGVLYDGGRPADRVIHRFGIRTASFERDRGFFLNGVRVPLRGCNRHESMPGFGNALPVELHRMDAKLIKEAGLNFVRLSHYPQHPAFLDACDELGILVYAEIATWKSVRMGRWLDSACRQMSSMIRRDRNHPSIILWGMGNESCCRGAYTSLRDLARELDPSRPVSYAENHFYRARRNRTIGIPDVWGCNYEFDALDEGRRASRLGAVVVTECSNYPHAVRGDRGAEMMQAELIRRDIAAVERQPAVAGYALWNFNDYATMRKRRYKRHCGIVDAWRVPKMSFFLLQALYLERPFVKVFGDWGTAGPAGERELRVFTNCGRVVFSAAGRDIMAADGSACFTQRLPYCPVTLTVAGVKGGERICTVLLEPFDKPDHLELGIVRPAAGVPGRGAVIVDVSVCDSEGRVVESFNGEIAAGVSGPFRLRTNMPDGRVRISSGTGRIFLTPTGGVGEGRLTASCAGVAGGELGLPDCGRAHDTCV